jgi:uroporphyrin-III C-methyltransferase/precorrin-2 dehydrogenase/sirohydrochlorin ferrochelatase/uroporphyrin-III C-methyltransferase
MSKVYLIGAGPGDPELLTVKAARLLQAADAVVYDRLVGDGVMDLVPAGAARIYVGKGPGRRHMAQDEINELLFRTARPDRTVVRLKGGDPFVFGRGSEEALYLRTRGVPMPITCSCSRTIPAKWSASPRWRGPWACASPGTTTGSV